VSVVSGDGVWLAIFLNIVASIVSILSRESCRSPSACSLTAFYLVALAVRTGKLAVSEPENPYKARSRLIFLVARGSYGGAGVRILH
jgi:hypothetical protein